MSALPSKADMIIGDRHVRFGPDSAARTAT
jgi:hypothetical protein